MVPPFSIFVYIYWIFWILIHKCHECKSENRKKAEGKSDTKVHPEISSSEMMRWSERKHEVEKYENIYKQTKIENNFFTSKNYVI